MTGLTWFWPSVAVAVLVSWMVAPAVARILRTERWLAWLLVFSVGFILAATATPIRAPVGIDIEIQRACDLTRRSFATLPEVTAWSDVVVNIGVYIPVGVAVALLPISVRSGVAVLGVIALPAAVEGLQFLAPLLARGCQSADVVDGLTGLMIGLGVGLIVRIARWPWSRIHAAN